MTLPLPPVNADDSVQFNFDQLATRFPLGAQDLKDDAVTAAKIATGAVGTTELAAMSVTAAKLGTGTLQVPGGVSIYKFNFGVVGWNMAAVTSVDVTTNHGLGAAPTIAVGTPSGASLIHVVLFSTSSTQITWRVVQSDNVARTQSGNVYWVAVV